MKNDSPALDNRFSEKYYANMMSGRVQDLTWLGVPVVKCPTDLLMVQEIIVETKPDLIIETGVFHGGSALFMASICDLIDHGRVLGVELQTDRSLPEHPRIDYLLGMSSTDPVVVSHVARRADGLRAMVVLDSAHNRAHVLDELRLYSPFVAKGNYLIVEDTNIHGYPYAPGDILVDGGPAEALKEWRAVTRDYAFEVDRSQERLMMTFHPGGFLRRIR